MRIFNVYENISITILLLSLIAFCIILVLTRSKYIPAKETGKKNSTKFAVIIPARYESAVIGGALESIKNSDYPEKLFTVFVIVESMADKTVGIVENYPFAKIYLRKDFSGQGKGYALDECMKSILSGGEIFDAFVILDADNVIDKKFFSEMDGAYRAGYPVACGRRENKYPEGVVSICSALTFTFINVFKNSSHKRRGENALLTGTGYYVSYDVIKSLGGWRFHSLTEDYEFTAYTVLNGIESTYVDTAVFYDEQPVSLKQSVIQRSRWIRGFFAVRLKYGLNKGVRKDTDGLKYLRFLCSLPVLVMAFDVILYSLIVLLGTLTALFFDISRAAFFGGRLAGILISLYLIFALAGATLLFLNKDDRITFKNAVAATLFNPIFLFTYVICFVRALFIGDKWERIEHKNKEERSGKAI